MSRKNRLKTAFRFMGTAFLIAVLSVMLSGCSLFVSGAELLSPPKPLGKSAQMSQAIYDLAGKDTALKYPTSGEYRSAIVLYDLNGDGNKVAIAFYETDTEEVSTMHITVVYQKDGKYVACHDVSTPASGVERVEFGDLNNDGKAEIIVGWGSYGKNDKTVAVYSFENEQLTQRMQEQCSEFLVCDLNTDRKNELFVIRLNPTEKTAAAHLYELEENGISERSSCETDGGVTSYMSVSSARLLDGKPAVYVDSKIGGGSQTEVLYLQNDRLVNPLYDNGIDGEVTTRRPTATPIRDINGDGVPDIPLTSVLYGHEEKSENDRVYLTRFCAYDGKSLRSTENAIVNYTDGYYVTLNSDWMSGITVERVIENRERRFYRYDTQNGVRKEEMFRIFTVNLNMWESDTYTKGGAIMLKSDETTVYAAKINKDFVSEEEVKKAFHLLENKNTATKESN